MTDTVISSATREVVLGLERPFVMIGERINPTGRKILAAEMAAGNFSRVESDALAQVAAGAHMLDVNAGIPLADEPAILAKAVQLVQSITAREEVRRSGSGDFQRRDRDLRGSRCALRGGEEDRAPRGRSRHPL